MTHLHHGDALDWLPTLPTGSIDALITDPPYASGGLTAGDPCSRMNALIDTSTDRQIAGSDDTPHAALLQKLDALAGRLERPVLPPIRSQDVLWTTADIAAWLQLAREVVERRVVNRDDFPAPLQPCLTGARAGKRWFAGDVIAWGRAHRGNVPKPDVRTRATPESANAPALTHHTIEQERR